MTHLRITVTIALLTLLAASAFAQVDTSSITLALGPLYPGVRNLLSKYHMRNFSIYLQQLDDGKYCLFGYYEYDGSDYSGDMAKLAAEKRNIEWLSVTDPMQNPRRGRHGWTQMDEVYHNGGRILGCQPAKPPSTHSVART